MRLERGAFGIGDPAELVDLAQTGKDERAHRTRREAAALLVGPGDDRDRMVGLDTGIVEAFENLEASQHAVGAIETAAERLGIDMAAGCDGRTAS